MIRFRIAGKLGYGSARRVLLGGAGLAAVAVVGAGPVDAQITSEEFLACQRIENREERYRCYDQLELDIEKARAEDEARQQEVKRQQEFLRQQEIARQQEEARKQAELRRQEEERVRAEAQRRRDFGDPAANDDKELEFIEVLVISASKNQRGRWVFRTESGQVWIQSNTERYSPPNGSFKAVIEDALVSGFYLSAEGQKRKIRVKRLK